MYTILDKMTEKEIINYFQEQYPGKNVVKLPSDKPTEIICELEPSSEHPEHSIAIAAISLSKPHYHRRTTELYELISGKLTLAVNDKSIELNPGDTYTVSPQQIHSAKGDFTLVKVTSRPGWTPDDHVLVKS